MKVFVKTLKGTKFEIEVKLEDTVADVKINIETVQGPDVYPASQQMLIHQGKVLKDGTTLEENKVSENSFIVIMLSKSKSSSGEASTAAAAPKATQTRPAIPATLNPNVSISLLRPLSDPESVVNAVNAALRSDDVYRQAASHMVSENNVEGAIQQILDMGGGDWDRDMVVRAFRAAFNNPERAVEYLYSGIPEAVEVPPVEEEAPPVAGAQSVQAPQPTQAAAVSAPPPSGPNASPLNLFPQDGGVNAPAGADFNLDILRNNQRFQDFRARVQANPQILQSRLQELSTQSPLLSRLVHAHQADFIRLLNEPTEGTQNVVGQQQQQGGMTQSVSITAEDLLAIERLEAMGFERSLVLEVFFACDKNEELSANYLLDHMHEFGD